MDASTAAWLILSAGFLLTLGGAIMLVSRYFVSVQPDQALLVSTSQGHQVRFAGGLVVPIVQTAQVIDLSLKTFALEVGERAPLRLADESAVAFVITFFLRVNPTQEDVLRVVRNFGAAQASNPEAARVLLEPKLAEALESAADRYDYYELERLRRPFIQEILADLEDDELGGFVVEDAAIEHVRLVEEPKVAPSLTESSEPSLHPEPTSLSAAGRTAQPGE